MEEAAVSISSHMRKRFLEAVNEGRQRGLAGPDLTSFALLQLVARVLQVPVGLTPRPRLAPVCVSTARNRHTRS